MGKIKRKLTSEENVPLIRPSSSDPDLVLPSTSSSSNNNKHNQQTKKWTRNVVFHSTQEPKTCYSSTNSSSERLSDYQTTGGGGGGKSNNCYYFDPASSNNSDSEFEHFNHRFYFNKQDHLNNNIMNNKLNKSVSVEHISGKSMNDLSTKRTKGLNHPPYNHQNSNRSDLALVQEKSDLSGMTSNLQTMMHLLKGNIGTGILATPNAFGNSGLLTGTILLPIIGSIAVHCMHLLVNSHNSITKRFGCASMDYEDVAEHAFLCGPKSLRKLSKVFRRLVMGFLLVTQIGFCASYSIFVADTLHAVIRNLTLDQVNLSTHVYMLMQLPIMILICSLRDLKTLSIFSTIANVLQSIGLVIILIALVDDLPPSWTRKQFNGFEKLPLYFGTVIYAFEGIGIVLPLQKEMKDGKAFRGFFGVLNTGMIMVSALYVAIGFFGYLRFGDEVLLHGSITLNLPFTPLNETVKLMFAVALFLTFPLQFYVPMNILWPIITDGFDLDKNSPRTNWFEITFKSFMVTITFLIAAAIPKLDLFVSLVGALSSSSLALIFPPIIDLLVRCQDEKTTPNAWKFILVKNLSIISLGLVGFSLGTYESSKNIYYELLA